MPHQFVALKPWLYAAITLVIWSGFVVVSRVGGQSVLTPYDIVALRVGTSALLLIPWWMPQLVIPARRRWKLGQGVFLAVVAGFAYPLVVYTGFVFAPASHGAVLTSGMLPFFTSILALIMLGERPGRRRQLGLFLILVGVGTLLLSSQSGHSHQSGHVLLGDLILLLASFLWALFTVLLRYWRIPAFDVTLAVAGLAALMYLPFYAFILPKHLGQAPLQSIVLQAFFQGVLVVCVAMWTYARATELLGTVRMVILMSTVPLIGTFLAILLLGEHPSLGTMFGAGLTGLGALLGSLAARNVLEPKAITP